MSAGLSEMSVVEARRGRVWPLKLTEAVGRSSSLSTISSTAWSGSVLGVMGASESSLLFWLHSIDSPDDLGDVCSGWDGTDLGLMASCGTTFGSHGIGSSGCEVAVTGSWCCAAMVEEAMA